MSTAVRTSASRPKPAKLATNLVLRAKVEQRDRVEDQAERAELVFHAFAVAVAQLAFLAMEHGAGAVVAAFLRMALMSRR